MTIMRKSFVLSAATLLALTACSSEAGGDNAIFCERANGLPEVMAQLDGVPSPDSAMASAVGGDFEALHAWGQQAGEALDSIVAEVRVVESNAPDAETKAALDTVADAFTLISVMADAAKTSTDAESFSTIAQTQLEAYYATGADINASGELVDAKIAEYCPAA